jgi:hypothetical protein
VPRIPRPRLLPTLLLAPLLAGLAAPAAGRAEAPWLVVDEPAALEATVAEDLVEVRGHGGGRRGAGHDVVIVIDVSESTLEDSGIDLDGDGPEGRSDPELVRWLENELGADAGLVRRFRDQQDFDDTVLAAELEAAEALIARLDPGRFQVGVVVFAENAHTIAPLGSTREALAQVLRDVRFEFHQYLGGTNFAAAVERAHAMLKPDVWAPPGERLRSIVFLSDGAPTRPVRGDRAERYALDAARAAGRDGIRLYAFAIGPEAEAGLAVMQRMAVWTSGRLETVSQPAQIVSRLRRVDLVDLSEITVANATTGAPARALRIFPDGHFDAFVSLATGHNTIRFEARGRDGSVHRVERTLVYVPRTRSAAQADGAGPDAEDLPAVGAGSSALLERLRERSAELESWADLERRRDGQRRELELRVEETR